ncbi:hypothetical protein EOA60_03135 [Mesorhizobium sp. M1A.F.Ca.IN.020.06.1.1]|uniref:hypothetical protein n=1 Tax=unclassified Mesorhizobium TaxID=325217 RepID=UPI000FCB521A|nr:MULTISPECIES: hypothetical protein [unclassified Mesorhizobium]RUU96661.1 hypothetical protein EOA79_26180 [Mesorhizobium sp. M1A.F.Ca.IN.020.03.2.1]RUW10603.1 hypothetical protein EOA46_14785 [Mesorhizobium sp. M1A.F.Ca.IN.022.05.2.1]RUW36250.1 hypothetical protein EOA60_03135 [Mesorhizobium sp. M1A.F.Ca.IN.020.06.1.1]RWF82362.1 MAG: hypothetical protein EOQ35_10445 [Mesorhizobium sp.]RWG04411.1 MAG: hypothetical protein EOQ38_06140 [Mesorhizobium sp.]
MLPITLEWQVCPDGVRADFDVEGDKLFYLPRSERRTSRAYNVSDLSSPLVLNFLNSSSTVEKRANFFAAYGLLEKSVCTDDMVSDALGVLDKAVKVGPLADHPERIAILNDLLSESTAMHLGFDYLGLNQTRRMVIRPRSLFDLMCAEIAMAAEVDAALTSCENCSRLFYTGHLTGRRNTARYCSDRCRAAANRKLAGGR